MTTITGARLACVSLIALAALAACSKPAPPSSSAAPAASSAAASSAAASAAPASAAAPTPSGAEALAAALSAPGAFDLASNGYVTISPMSCTGPGSGDAFTMQCQAMVADPDRSGSSDLIDIQLFDQDTAFASLDNALSARITALNQTWTANQDPGISATPNAGGASVNLPGMCRQAVGATNSPAYCQVMQTPRVYVMVAVPPLTASTQTLTFGGNSDQNSDMSHASDLLVLVMGQIGDQLPS